MSNLGGATDLAGGIVSQVAGDGGLLDGGLLSNIAGSSGVTGGIVSQVTGDAGGGILTNLGGITSQVSGDGGLLSGGLISNLGLTGELLTTLGPSIATLTSQSSQIFQITKSISTITSSATNALSTITTLTTSISSVFSTVNQVATEASTGLGQSPTDLTSAIGGVQDATQSFVGNFNAGSPVTQQIVGPSITQVFQSVQKFVQVARTYTKTAYDQLSVDQITAQQTVVHVTKIVVTLQTVVQVASTTITSLTTYERLQQNVEVSETFTKIINRIRVIVQSISTKSTSVVVIKNNLQSVYTGLEGVDSYFPRPGPVGILPTVGGVNLPIGNIGLPVVHLPVRGHERPLNQIQTIRPNSDFGPDQRSYLETKPGDFLQSSGPDDDNSPVDDDTDYQSQSINGPDDDDEVQPDDSIVRPVDSDDDDDSDDVPAGQFLAQQQSQGNSPLGRLYIRFQTSLRRIRHYVVKNIRRVNRNHLQYKQRTLKQVRSILSVSKNLVRYLTTLRPVNSSQAPERARRSFSVIRGQFNDLQNTLESLKPRLSKPQVQIINELTNIIEYVLRTSKRIITVAVQRISNSGPLSSIKIEFLRRLIAELNSISLPTQRYITPKSIDRNAPSFGDDEIGPDDSDSPTTSSFIARGPHRRRPILTGTSSLPYIDESTTLPVNVVTSTSPVVTTVVGGDDIVNQQTTSTAAASSTATSQTTTVEAPTYVAPTIVAPTVIQHTTSSSAASSSTATTQSTTVATPVTQEVIRPSPIRVTRVTSYPEQDETPVLSSPSPQTFASIRPRTHKPHRIYRPITALPHVLVQRPRPIHTTHVLSQSISSSPTPTTIVVQRQHPRRTTHVVSQSISTGPTPTPHLIQHVSYPDTTPIDTYPVNYDDDTVDTPSFASIRPTRRPIHPYHQITQPIRRPRPRPIHHYTTVATAPIDTVIVDTPIPNIITEQPVAITTSSTSASASSSASATTETTGPLTTTSTTASAVASATATTSVVTGNTGPIGTNIFNDFVNSLNSAFSQITGQIRPLQQINVYPVIRSLHRVHLSIHTLVLYVSQLNVDIVDTVSSSSIILEGFREIRHYFGRLVQVVQSIVNTQQVTQVERIRLVRVVKYTSAIVAITITEVKRLVQTLQYNSDDVLWNAIQVLLQRLVNSYERVFGGFYDGLADQNDGLSGLSYLQNNLLDTGDDRWSPVYRGISQSTAQILDNSIVNIGQTISQVSDEYKTQLNNIDQIIGDRDDGHPATQYLRQLANRLRRNNARLDRVDERLNGVLNVLRNLQAVGSNGIDIGGADVVTSSSSSSASSASSSSSESSWNGAGWKSSSSSASASASASSRSTLVYTKALQFGDLLATNLYKYSGFPQAVY